MASTVGNIKVLELEDPSEYRPEFKSKENYRNYHIHTCPERVVNTYTQMHTNQTLSFVKKSMEKWCKLDHCQMTIMDAVINLDNLVDHSDPDVDMPNSEHAFQTAEALRRTHPDKDWLHLTGLIHDLGKVMALWGVPQWAVVGDTFPVGCRPAENIVFGAQSFKDNPDINDPKLNTKLGIYEENCGLKNVLMSWGHDEYLYRVLKGNNCTLPEEALYIVRFHSFYPWHNSGSYNYLCDNQDMEMMKWVNEFNKFDLYSKSDVTIDRKQVCGYYQGLIDKYVPGKLNW